MFWTEITERLQLRQRRRSHVLGLEREERPLEDREPPTRRGQHWD